MDFSLQSLDVQIQFGTENGTDQIWRWVSNAMERTNVEGPEPTEQMIGTPIDGITILGVATGAAEPQLLPPRYQEIELLPPVDPYFEEGNTEGNIYNNQGEGIAFYALTAEEGLGSDEGRRYLIAEMQRQPDGQYTLDYRNSDFVGTFQELNEDSGLYVTSHQGQLYFRGKSNEGVEINTSRFLITALDHGDIRPGDDFLLQFALKDRSNVRGTANMDDVCAIFDHKMLWRANLYVDEGAGNADWNNRHRWNSEHNEWNRIYNISRFINNDFDMDDLNIIDNVNGHDLVANGGQVIQLHPFTHSWRGENDRDIEDHVSYEYNGTDSPFLYQYKMDNQRMILSNFYTAGGALKSEEPENQTAWDSTLAPEGLHSNYFHGSNYPYGATAQSAEDGARELEDQSLTIDENTYRPYVPALEDAMLNLSTASVPYNMSFPGAGFGAGTDCLGFSKRSSSYPRSQYNWVSNDLPLPLVEWGENRTGTYWPVIGSYSHNVTDHSEDIIIDNFVSFRDLDLIKPGDIFYYYNLDGDEISHIGIVKNIENTNNVNLRPSDIELIEAMYTTGEDAEGRIFNSRTLESIRNRMWYIVRLEVEE